MRRAGVGVHGGAPHSRRAPRQQRARRSLQPKRSGTVLRSATCVHTGARSARSTRRATVRRAGGGARCGTPHSRRALRLQRAHRSLQPQRSSTMLCSTTCAHASAHSARSSRRTIAQRAVERRHVAIPLLRLRVGAELCIRVRARALHAASAAALAATSARQRSRHSRAVLITSAR